MQTNSRNILVVSVLVVVILMFGVVVARQMPSINNKQTIPTSDPGNGNTQSPQDQIQASSQSKNGSISGTVKTINGSRLTLTVALPQTDKMKPPVMGEAVVDIADAMVYRVASEPTTSVIGSVTSFERQLVKTEDIQVGLSVTVLSEDVSTLQSIKAIQVSIDSAPATK